MSREPKVLWPLRSLQQDDSHSAGEAELQGPHKRTHVGGVVLEQQAAQRVVLEVRRAAPGARRHRQAVVVHRRAQHAVQAVLLHACARGPTGHG